MTVHALIYPPKNTIDVFGNVIAWQGWSQWSHVATVFDDAVLFESTRRHGVIQRAVTDYDRKVAKWRYPTEPGLVCEGDMYRWMRSKVGSQYDMWGCIRFILRSRGVTDDRWFCSEYAADAWSKAGYPLLTNMTGWKFHPYHFDITPRLADC